MSRPLANRLTEPSVVHPLIDVHRSIIELGVDPRYLKPNSYRLVICYCAVCFKGRVKKFKYASSQHACLECSNKLNAQKSIDKRSISMKAYYAAGGKHPTKGIGHSEATKIKISESRTGKSVHYTAEGRQRLVEHCLRVLNNPETKAKTTALNRLRKGPLSQNYGRKPPHTHKVWYEKTDGARVCFRSTWEAMFATWLDDNQIVWEYEVRPYAVTYILEGKTVEGTYTPDFKTPSGWYEVKGRWTPEGKAKFDAFKATYQENVTLIDRAWLQAHNLLPPRSMSRRLSK